MKSLPKEFRTFFWLITLSAVLVMGYSLYHTTWSLGQTLNLLIFVALAIASESMPVALPKGGYVTVSYSIFFASSVLFPLGMALCVAVFAGASVVGKAGKDQPLFKRVFNASQFVLSLWTAGLVIQAFGVNTYQLSLGSVTVYLASALTFIIVNVTVVALALGFLSGTSPWSIWVSNIRGCMLNFAALAPLGLLMSMIFFSAGIFGLLLFAIPLLLARHSFQRYIDMRDNYFKTIQALVRAIEAKDTYTEGHSTRVAEYSVAIAEELGLKDDLVEGIRYTAILHDVGKIGISEAILNKREKLADSEWEAIRNHPVIGEKIVKDIDFLYDIHLGVRHHHERYDGKGYPDGLKGEEIPLVARVIAVADSFDAMTSDRTYRRGKNVSEALAELRRVAGTQLDQTAVEAFIKVYPQLDINWKTLHGGSDQLGVTAQPALSGSK
ncbi:MAG TPA: HD-GYP domain-containing protein [Desulfobacteria bacterium]|nr:HD-GYP domain-containing protein [Desulfobacteria bacterium]